MGDNSASFGDVLRHLRLAAFFSQEELAERAGLSARAISDLERGVRQGPRPETLRLLADALSVDDPGRATLFAAAHRERRAVTEPGGSGQVIPLPQLATSLVGREQERDELSALLCRPDVRLVTLTGMGGIGKTHLAIDVARRARTVFRDGAAFVDLAPLTDSGHVIPTLARAIGIHESRGQAILRTVIATLGEKRMLLLLDNCEQVLDAASALAEVLASCPGVTLLATSREALKMRGE
jgi:transcriptional regulator with XRE-family HTH domain